MVYLLGVANPPLSTSWMNYLYYLVIRLGLERRCLMGHCFGGCTSRFARKVPTWRLPAAGKVAGLLTCEGGEAGSVCAAPSVHAPGDGVVLGCVHGGGGSGLSRGKF